MEEKQGSTGLKLCLCLEKMHLFKKKNYEQDKTEMKIVFFVEVVTINTRNIWHEGDVFVE